MIFDLERRYTPEEVAYGAYSLSFKAETEESEIQATLELLEELMNNLPDESIGLLFETLEQVEDEIVPLIGFTTLVKEVFETMEQKAQETHPHIINKYQEIYTHIKIGLIEKLLERLSLGWDKRSLGVDNQTLQKKYHMVLVERIINKQS